MPVENLFRPTTRVILLFIIFFFVLCVMTLFIHHPRIDCGSAPPCVPLRPDDPYYGSDPCTRAVIGWQECRAELDFTKETLPIILFIELVGSYFLAYVLGKKVQNKRSMH